MPLTNCALALHAAAPAGKLGLALTKPCDTPHDLSLAYSPGVAAPCLAIHDNPADVYRYTGRSNLVGVITNGSAVLGLGNIGPAAAKPVMEGKGALDTRATTINDAMLLAATEAIRNVAHEPAPDLLRALYPDEDLRFGPQYLIPKPFDPRVVVRVAVAVADAAMRTGAAGQAVDLTSYAADVARRTARPIGVAVPGARR
jgi:malic enzyme